MRKHKDWIQAYMEYSKHSEAPDKFHFWTAASVVAGALRRRVWIDQGYFQWTPNMYIVFVAPPGIVSKSTTASIGMNLLRKLPDIHFGPDAVTWQALAQALANSTEEVPIIGLNGEEEFHPMSALTIVSSEFGTFLNPNDREMVDVLVSLWDGQKGSWKKATKTCGDDIIVNPWINILACTTPAWIAGNFPQYMIGGGFTSRCVFVYSEQKRQLIAYPADHISTSFAQQELDLVHDLEIISQMKGAYHLSLEARKWGVQWYEEHYHNRPKHLSDAQFGGYIARKQTHIHKLAMVLSAACSDTLVIQKDFLEAANLMVTALEYDMPKVFQQVGANDAGRITGLLHEFLRTHRRMKKQEVYRHFLSKVSGQDIDIAVAGLVTAGIIKVQQLGEDILFIFQELQEDTNNGL